MIPPGCPITVQSMGVRVANGAPNFSVRTSSGVKVCGVSRLIRTSTLEGVWQGAPPLRWYHSKMSLARAADVASDCGSLSIIGVRGITIVLHLLVPLLVTAFVRMIGLSLNTMSMERLVFHQFPGGLPVIVYSRICRSSYLIMHL